KRRLITHRRRNAAEKRRHFRTRLGKPEYIVDEEQHVLSLVTEIFRDRQTCKADASTCTRWLVHLAVHQGAFRTLDRSFPWILVHTGFDHFMIKVVALARAFADAGEHRKSAVRFCNIVDKFHDHRVLPASCPAEQADLAALGVRREQIYHLDTGD